MSKSIYTSRVKKNICFLHIYTVHLYFCFQNLLMSFSPPIFPVSRPHILSGRALPWMMSYWCGTLNLIFYLSWRQYKQWKDQPALPVTRSALDWPSVQWTTSEAFSSCLPLGHIGSTWQKGIRNWLGSKSSEVKCVCACVWEKETESWTYV